jgi:hypothetical protein
MQVKSVPKYFHDFTCEMLCTMVEIQVPKFLAILKLRYSMTLIRQSTEFTQIKATVKKCIYHTGL